MEEEIEGSTAIEELKNSEHQIDEDSDYEEEEIYNINSWGADLSFRELMFMYDDDELIKPEIQRNYVWDKPTASRFIESILMGLPVPSIFLSKMKNDKYLIIDGFQRFMSVNDFCSGKFQDGSLFKLTNSKKIQEKWRGKSFLELDEDDKRKIRTTTIHAIIFDYKSDSSLFQIFERINTGGRTLSHQEIRNCLYHNSFNKFLIDLNKDQNWRNIYGNDKIDRMYDIEHILRFFALKTDDVKSKESGQLILKKYLSEFMGSNENQQQEIHDVYKDQFTKTVKYLNENFDRSIFKSTSMKSPIFDSIAIATCYALTLKEDELEPINLGDLESLLKDVEYKFFTTNRTTNYQHINKRINLACQKLYGVDYIDS